MDRQEQYNQHQEYIKEQGLDKLIDFTENINYQYKTFDSVSEKFLIPYPPEPSDLIHLHKLIRQRKCFTVLEFGVGYSTIVIADALQKNERDWEALRQKPEIRNRFMFQLFSVDASEKWISDIQLKFPKHLIDRAHFQYSEAEIGAWNGQLCHYYKNLPDIVPDFIYSDAPIGKDVKGNINGLSFGCYERTPMAADLLLMESTFLPGTFILIDGRTNNARFLEKNFGRRYKKVWDKENDFTSFELDEERLGKYNLLGSDFF